MNQGTEMSIIQTETSKMVIGATTVLRKVGERLKIPNEIIMKALYHFHSYYQNMLLRQQNNEIKTGLDYSIDIIIRAMLYLQCKYEGYEMDALPLLNMFDLIEQDYFDIDIQKKNDESVIFKHDDTEEMFLCERDILTRLNYDLNCILPHVYCMKICEYFDVPTTLAQQMYHMSNDIMQTILCHQVKMHEIAAGVVRTIVGRRNYSNLSPMQIEHYLDATLVSDIMIEQAHEQIEKNKPPWT